MNKLIALRAKEKGLLIRDPFGYKSGFAEWYPIKDVTQGPDGIETHLDRGFYFKSMDDYNNLKKSPIPAPKFPMKGYADGKVLEYVTIIKHSIPVLLDFLNQRIVKTILVLLAFLLPKEVIKKIGFSALEAFVDFAYRVFAKYTLKSEEYSPFTREIYRLFNILIEREDERIPVSKKMKDVWTKLRDIVCMILEMDGAYKFRAQDALSCIDLSKIKFDESDKYWCHKKADYNFGGLTVEQRKQWWSKN